MNEKPKLPGFSQSDATGQVVFGIGPSQIGPVQPRLVPRFETSAQVPLERQARPSERLGRPSEGVFLATGPSQIGPVQPRLVPRFETSGQVPPERLGAHRNRYFRPPDEMFPVIGWYKRHLEHNLVVKK